MIDKAISYRSHFIRAILAKSSIGRRMLDFFRRNNLSYRILNESSWFLVANLIFSASTYMVGILVPYLLNTDYMAYLSAGNQIVMVLAIILEFGISISFLRFYQIDKDSIYIFSILQVMMLLLIIVIMFFFADEVNYLFNIHLIPVDVKLFYIIIIGQYGWGFIKTWLLATNQVKYITLHAVIISVLRLVSLIYLYLLGDFSLTQLLLATLLFPFIPSLIHQAYLTARVLIEGIPLMKGVNRQRIRKFFEKTYDYLQFSLFTYLANFIFLYTGRYLMIYLTGKNNAALADLGYAMTFLGIVLVFYTTIRNYLVARLSKNNSDFIFTYLKGLKRLMKYMLAGFFILSLLLSWLIMKIKPAYLSENTGIFAFIFFLATFINAYIGLFTVLSKTYDYNKTELLLNGIRFLAVVAITNFVVKSNIILGVILINIAMVAFEFIFARIILKRIAVLYEKTV